MKYICCPNAIARMGPKRFSWIFLGDGQKTLNVLSETYGIENQFNLDGRFHEVTKRIKPLYLDYMARLGEKNKDSLNWWASATASKSPYLSQLFKLLCYRALIKELISENDNIAIFIEDPYFYDHLRKTSFTKNVSFVGRPGNYQVRSLLRGLLVRMYLLVSLIWQKARIFNSLNIDLSEVNVLLFSWVQDRSFDKDMNFIDHYAGDIKQYFEKKSKKVLRFSFAIMSSQLMSKIKNAKEKIVVNIKYVPLRKIIRSVLSRFSFNYQGLEHFDGDNISDLLKREIQVENTRPGFVEALVFYYGMRSIFKRSKSLQIVFYLYEGQPWERMLLKALKMTRPGIKAVGYQHSSFASMYLSHFLGLNESNYAPLPDLLLSNSEYNRKRLVEGGFKEDQVKNIGALRYAYLFEKDGQKNNSRKINDSVLICLPYIRKLACEMLTNIAPFLIKLKKEGRISEIKIKSHPLVPIDLSEISKAMELPNIARQIGGTLKDELLTSEILIFCNGTVGIEGIFAGTKVIKFLPQMDLDLDPCAGTELEKLMDVCYGSDDFKEVMLKVLNRSAAEVPGERSLSVLDPFDPRKLDQALELSMGSVKK